MIIVLLSISLVFHHDPDHLSQLVGFVITISPVVIISLVVIITSFVIINCPGSY